MKNRISVLLVAVVLCGPAAAQSSAVNSSLQGRTRAEVQAELACARASGEHTVLNGGDIDPQALQAARARAATTPACHPGMLGRSASDTPAAAPASLQRTRADVQAELACAQASSEHTMLNSSYEPAAIQAARARAASTPECRNAIAQTVR